MRVDETINQINQSCQNRFEQLKKELSSLNININESMLNKTLLESSEFLGNKEEKVEKE